jgi:hypothetical protein
MQEERDAVTSVINTLHAFPIRAEFFVARSDNPVEVCIDRARQCSIYVGIFKKRYGFIPDLDGGNPGKLSMTALEYEAARNAGRPLKLFVSKDSDGRDAQLTQFLDQIGDPKTGHWRKNFSNIDELKYWVTASLAQEIIQQLQSMNAEALGTLLSLDDKLLSAKFVDEHADIDAGDLSQIVVQVIREKKTAEQALRRIES